MAKVDARLGERENGASNSRLAGTIHSAADPREQAELMTGGILDSLATLKLVSFLEETYSISIDPHELAAENLNSIAQIASFVQSKQA